MRGLSQFVRFDFEAFSQGKEYLVVGLSDYVDYSTKQRIGTKVDCIILVDKTPYKFKDGETFTNRFEKISFKVARDVDIPIESRVVPKNVTATVYGDFKNQLSCRCEDIAVVSPREK